MELLCVLIIGAMQANFSSPLHYGRVPDLAKLTAASDAFLHVGPKHALDGRADESGLTEDDKLELVIGNQSDILALDDTVRSHCRLKVPQPVFSFKNQTRA
jgi:hypothetical protein